MQDPQDDMVKSEVIVTDNQLPPEVISAIQKGRKVEAIKILREETGLGLANAKVLVDRAYREYGPPKPPYSPMDPSNVVPSMVKSVFLGVLLVGIYYFFFMTG